MSAPTISDLSVQLLESDAVAYLDTLNYLAREGTAGTKEELEKKLNETLYETWYSNHAFCVAYLVGKMNKGVIDSFGEYSDDYYGGNLPNGLNEYFAISLIDKIIECGGNILDKNYYQENIIEIYKGRFYRTDNEKFKEYVKRLYENKLS